MKKSTSEALVRLNLLAMSVTVVVGIGVAAAMSTRTSFRPFEIGDRVTFPPRLSLPGRPPHAPISGQVVSDVMENSGMPCLLSDEAFSTGGSFSVRSMQPMPEAHASAYVLDFSFPARDPKPGECPSSATVRLDPQAISSLMGVIPDMVGASSYIQPTDQSQLLIF